MLHTSLEPPIVKSGGKVKNPADGLFLKTTEFLFEEGSGAECD